jgi:hypothetical protein
MSDVLTYDCRDCGVQTAATVLRRRGGSVELRRVSEGGCEHGEIAIGDLVEGLDPGQRCEGADAIHAWPAASR